MAEGVGGEHAAARRALHEALLDQVGLDDLLDGVARLGERRGHCLDADRPAAVVLGNGAKIAAVHGVETGVIDLERKQRPVGKLAIDLLHLGGMGEVAHAAGTENIDRKLADRALLQLEVDAAGLDAMDRRYLTVIAENYGGGPVGVETLAAALSEPRDAIEEIIEPYLIQKGFVQRTPRGRVLTNAAFGHLGLPMPSRDPAQIGLFSGDSDE